MQNLNTYLLLATLAAVYLLKRTADKKISEITQPAGQLLSDLWAAAARRTGIELQPLMIRDSYLTDDWRLTAEAKEVLYSVPQYAEMLAIVFDNSGVLREEYRDKVNLRLGID